MIDDEDCEDDDDKKNLRELLIDIAENKDDVKSLNDMSRADDNVATSLNC